MGPAMTVCVTGDASGVRMAAAMKMMRTAYLKFRMRKRDVTMPMRARNSTTAGIWNTSPNATSIFMYRLNAGSTRGSNLMSSFEKLARNVQLIGNTTR